MRWNVGTGRSLAVWEADKGGRWCVGFPVDDDAQEVGAEVAEDEEGIEAEQHEVHDDDERVATHHVRIGFQETPNMSHATHLGRKATPQQATPALSEESGSPHTPYEPEGLETSMDRLTVSVAGARKRGTPARGLLGSYVDDEDDEDGASANGLGSEADMSPDASPFAFTASAALKRLGKDTPGKPLKNKLGGAKFFEEREIKVDDDVEKLPGGGYNGLSLGKVRLW